MTQKTKVNPTVDGQALTTDDAFSVKRLSDLYERGDHIRFARLMTGQTNFLNYGYFTAGNTRNYRQAQEDMADLACRLLKVQAGEIMLDVGCGRGGAALHAGLQYDAQVTGIDIDPVKIGHATVASGNERVRFVEADSQAMPFSDASFDCVYSIESAFHYPRKQDFIQECARVLKPGGRLCLIDFVSAGRKDLSPQDIAEIQALKEAWEFSQAEQLTSARWQDLIREASFQHIEELDISDQVFPPFLRRTRPLIRWCSIAPVKAIFGWWLWQFQHIRLDYVLFFFRFMRCLMEKKTVRYVAITAQMP